MEDGSDLEVMDRDNKVSWSATMGVWPCRPRDFVTHIRRATLDDGSVAIVNSATTHPNVSFSLHLFFVCCVFDFVWEKRNPVFYPLVFVTCIVRLFQHF